MADELKHKDPGGELTQAEFIATDGHAFDSQATGDILYASSATVLSRLAKSSTSTQYLANTGTSNVPQWNEVALDTGVSGALPVANGGTAATSAGIAAFNSITGYSAAGATGTTSTNVVFSTSPTLVTPALGTPSALVLANATELPTAAIDNDAVTLAKMAGITRGSMIIGDASGDPAALAKGTQNYVLTAGANDISWAAASSGAVVREGGDVGEETSTSNSSAVTSSTGTISILAGETAIVRWSARKTTGGGGESGTCGAHIYAGGTDTVICTPTTASTTTFPWGSADTDSAQNGPAGFFISGRSSSGTDYLNSSAGTVLGGYAPVGGGSSSVFAGQKMQVDDDYPAGEITRIDVLAIGGGAITVGTDFLNAYSFTGS